MIFAAPSWEGWHGHSSCALEMPRIDHVGSGAPSTRAFVLPTKTIHRSVVDHTHSRYLMDRLCAWMTRAGVLCTMPWCEHIINTRTWTTNTILYNVTANTRALIAYTIFTKYDLRQLSMTVWLMKKLGRAYTRKNHEMAQARANEPDCRSSESERAERSTTKWGLWKYFYCFWFFG